MNSTVGLIFNESFTEKVKFVGLVNSAWDPLESWNVLLNNQKKKKKTKTQITQISSVSKRIIRVCLESVYFTETENFLLKVL